MRFRNHVRASVAVVGLVLLGSTVMASASIPNQKTGSAKPRAGGTITVAGGGSMPVTLDPGTSATQPSSAPWFTLVYGQLFRHNPNNSISPALATSYTTSANGLTATLTLRHGVKFQDGTPFDASAVRFNLLRDVHGDASGTCPCEPFIHEIKSVTTAGKYVVNIHLAARDNLLYDVLSESTASYMISPAAYTQYGPLSYGLHPVGAGPYRVTQFTPSTSITFVKNDHYYDRPRPYIQQINAVAVHGDPALLAGLGSQTLDWVAFNELNAISTPGQARSADAAFTHEIATPRNMWMEIQPNAQKPPFNNIQARQALAEATDPAPMMVTVAGSPQATCQVQGPAQQLPVGTKCPKGYTGYNPTAAQTLVKQLDAKYGPNFMTFSIEDVVPGTVSSAIMAALQKEYQAVGMNVTLSIKTHGQMVADQADGNFNVFAPNPGGQDDNPYLSVSDLIEAGSPQNAFGYKSAALDALAVRVGTAKSPAQELSLWKQYLSADELEYANIPMWSAGSDEFLNDNLHGVVFAGRDVYFDSAWWTGP